MVAWLQALAGGVLIGLSATSLLWLNGRIAGVSGILNGVVLPKPADVSWRVAFLVGLIAAGGLYMALPPSGRQPRTVFLGRGLVVPGLLDGFVARMGNGSTTRTALGG